MVSYGPDPIDLHRRASVACRLDVLPLVLPEQFGHRPVFAPETAEQTVSNRGERDKRALILLDLSGERSLTRERS